MKIVDKTNVFAICDELDAKGAKPTLAKVREALGGGSFTKIQPLLREWKDLRSAVAMTETIDTPPEVIELAKTLAVQLWAKAKAGSDRELKAVKKELDDRIAELEEENSDAALEVSQLEIELERGKKEGIELIEMVRSQEKKIHELEINKKGIQDRYEDLLYIQTKYESALEEVGKLKGILSQKK